MTGRRGRRAGEPVGALAQVADRAVARPVHPHPAVAGGDRFTQRTAGRHDRHRRAEADDGARVPVDEVGATVHFEHDRALAGDGRRDPAGHREIGLAELRDPRRPHDVGAGIPLGHRRTRRQVRHGGRCVDRPARAVDVHDFTRGRVRDPVPRRGERQPGARAARPGQRERDDDGAADRDQRGGQPRPQTSAGSPRSVSLTHVSLTHPGRLVDGGTPVVHPEYIGIRLPARRPAARARRSRRPPARCRRGAHHRGPGRPSGRSTGPARSRSLRR